jgi:hypothetical protein
MRKRFPNLRILALGRDTEASQIEQPPFALMNYLDKPFSGVAFLDRVALLLGEGVEE